MKYPSQFGFLFYFFPLNPREHAGRNPTKGVEGDTLQAERERKPPCYHFAAPSHFRFRFRYYFFAGFGNGIFIIRYRIAPAQHSIH